ncbi:hypothetical protein DSO57_1003124 [Entomophthora muscae]|uniref:Uncharacterized protein n=1 Tax=Entomophthora muscae TaxID=34485 RepID=A0ACC2UUU2_9FUNG|nr:hypothetical protein DSO57_1003124 [Entomophthora muscae]
MDFLGEHVFHIFSSVASLFYTPETKQKPKVSNAVQKVKRYYPLSEPIVLGAQMQWSISSYQFTEYHIRNPVKQTEYSSGNDTYTEFRRQYWIPRSVTPNSHKGRGNIKYLVTPPRPKYPVISLDLLDLALPQLQEESILPEDFRMTSNNSYASRRGAMPLWRPILLVVDAMCETCCPKAVVSTRFNIHSGHVLDGIYISK